MKNTKRPYVICHILSSVDGRIKPVNWPIADIGSAFESVAKKIKADAWLVGRTTMQEFSSKKSVRLGAPDRTIAKTDFVGAHRTKTYAVVVDPSGKCRWDSNMVTTEHVIEVLTEKVSTAYLRHLRDAQVSYVFAGNKDVDLNVALRKLGKLFGIKTVRVDGGGGVNGGFLRAGLIDELSHLVIPVIDGSTGVPTIFDAQAGHARRVPERLKLKSVKRLPGDILWMRYLVG